MQRPSGQRTVGDHALFALAIDQFPGLAVGLPIGQRPVQHGLEAAASPDARLVEGREAQQAIEEGHRPISVSQRARPEPDRGRDRLWVVLPEQGLE